jgi:hypothetical protein
MVIVLEVPVPPGGNVSTRSSTMPEVRGAEKMTVWGSPFGPVVIEDGLMEPVPLMPGGLVVFPLAAWTWPPPPAC